MFFKKDLCEHLLNYYYQFLYYQGYFKVPVTTIIETSIHDHSQSVYAIAINNNILVRTILQPGLAQSC